ncbi:MAG: CCA tRNA nucleotidyltransferase [Candidatus Bathyarchaeia archaeon]
MNNLEQVCAAAKARLAPTIQERTIVESTAEEIRRAVEIECRKAGLPPDVRIEGSVAKNTWIRNYADIDIFMLVSPELTKEQLSRICLPIARRALSKHRIIERYAEHPYIEAFLKKNGKELRVNIVPCYHVEPGNWLSATDRSPYHSQYVQEHLDKTKLDEVCLLKGFLRGINAYGADIKTGGFSGMLAETLVIGFGGFLNVIRNLSEWNEGKYLDVENYYANRTEEVRKIFTEPLIVIDPVDKGRNLGAAVHAEQLWNFVAASRYFLRKPFGRFFTQPIIKPLTRSEYEKRVKSRGSSIVGISFGEVNAVVDILWSQLYRTQRALSSFLANHDFNLIRSVAWSNEHEMNIILFELETSNLPNSKKHEGPPVNRIKESTAFISKHSNDCNTISGPWIEKHRWVVQKRRPNANVERLLKSAIGSEASKIGVASLFSRNLKSKTRIINQRTIAPLLSDKEFSRFMRIFLSGRPIWNAPE